MEKNNQKASLDFDDEFDSISSSRFKAVQPSLFDGMDKDTDPQELSAHEPRIAPQLMFKPAVQLPVNEYRFPIEFKPVGPEAYGIDPGMLERPPLIMGADIVAIRDLTGKKQDNAKGLLRKQTEDMMKSASPDCFYIKGDVRSSKNSKEIGRFKKYNKVTGKLEDFTTLVESKAAKEYRKATAGYWLQNKVSFLNNVRGVPLPVRLEFTFIRETLRKFDYPNAVQILLDMMVENGYLPDDETCYVLPVFNIVYYHKELAGVLIRIIN